MTTNSFECSICHHSIIEEKISFDDYEVQVCENCKYGIVYPIPTQQKLNELYNSEQYFTSHMNYDFSTISDNEIRKNIDNNKELHGSHLKPYLAGEAKKILEIGSGGGFALKALEGLGHSVLGIETSSSAVNFCRSKLKVDIKEASIESILLDEKYDIVMLNHVLEHFVDVKAATEKLSSFVKPDGILYIRVPDHDSYDRREYGKKWPAYAYYHISNFSESSLIKLFSLHNLKTLEVKKFVSEKAPQWVRKIAKGPLRNRLTDRYSGRSITIIAKKI